MSKLEATTDELRKMRSEGRSINEIAWIHGVSPSRISQLIGTRRKPGAKKLVHECRFSVNDDMHRHLKNQYCMSRYVRRLIERDMDTA